MCMLMYVSMHVFIYTSEFAYVLIVYLFAQVSWRMCVCMIVSVEGGGICVFVCVCEGGGCCGRDICVRMCVCIWGGGGGRGVFGVGVWCVGGEGGRYEER